MKIKKYHRQLMQKLRGVQIHSICASLIAIIVSMIPPFLMSKVIDNLSEEAVMNGRLGLLIIIVVIFSFVLDWYQNYHWFKMIYKGQSFFRGALFANVVTTPYHIFCKRKSGDITNRLINDTAQYAECSLISIPMLILNSLSLGVPLAFIIYYSVPIGVAILLICFIYFFSYKYINKKLRSYSVEERKGYSELMQVTNRFYEGIPTIQLFGTETQFSEKYQEKVEDLGKRNIRLQLWKSLALSLSGLIIDMMPVTAIIVGMFLMMKGECSIGAIFGIYAYTAYLGEPIRNLTDLNLNVQRAEVNKERLEEVMVEAKDEKYFGDRIQGIQLKDVKFSYDESEVILENFNISIHKGERIGIIGNSGSGKTTLSHILSGELVHASGEIRVNGKKTDIGEYRSRIAVLPQEIFLYDESVLNNIMFGRDELELAKIWEIMEIDKFSDRDVNELSGGEKRRVGLARALAGDFDLLILDEPTAEIDAVMEDRIVKFIDKMIDSEKMMIVITHRPRILDICTRILKIGEEY